MHQTAAQMSSRPALRQPIPTLDVSPPGRWEYPDRVGAEPVQITFAGVPDIAKTRRQLVDWRRDIQRCVAAADSRGASPPLVVPEIRRHAMGGPPIVVFPAPQLTGLSVWEDVRSIGDAVRTLRAAALALDALHANGFVHGALRLGSLWWMADGTLRFPDAGLARALETDAAGPVYGAAVASDEPGVGGALPSDDQAGLADLAEALLRHVCEELPAGRRARSGTPANAQLDTRRADALRLAQPVLRRARSAAPEARFRSCAQFVDTLAESARATPLGTPTIARSWMGVARSGPFRVLAGAAAVALVASLVVLTVRRSAARQRRTVAAVVQPDAADASSPAAKTSDAPPTVAVDSVRLAAPRASDSALPAVPALADSAAVGTVVLARARGGALFYQQRAIVFLDGIRVVPQEDRFSVTAGQHDVDILMPDMRQTRHRIVVRPGAVVTLPE